MNYQKDLTEKKLLELNFKKKNVSPEEAGDDEGYYYFTYDLFNAECLITQADNERDNEFYSVEFLNMPDAGKFWNSNQIIRIIQSIKGGF